MTRKRLTTVLLSLMLIGGVNAQTNTFRINYDQTLLEIPVASSEALTPGNFIFSGFHTNFLPIVSSLTEVDATGNVIWAKRYSGGISYMFGDFKKDPALNRYYVCGGSGNGPAFLMFVDATGNLISGRNFSIAQADGAFFNRVTKTSDGGYVCVGYVNGYDPDGAGPEIKFNPQTYTTGDCSETETIYSPIIVKFDASGNHLWHHVFRYYVTSATPANRIYNSASFVDIVEVSDGYLAVGSYKVNNVFSSVNSDCEDTTPTDAIFLKTTTAGAITYHRQIDNPSNSTTQTSKSLSSASLTSTGLPLISGSDGTGRPCLLMRLASSGGWANPTWIRKYAGAEIILFGFPTGDYYPLIPSRFFETSDGNYALWSTYLPVSGLFPVFSNALMKINPSTNSVFWARQHVFDFASILPHGFQASDGGYYGVSYNMSGAGHDLHFIKTDENGDAPLSCAASNITTSSNGPSYTYGTPIYNSWNGNTVTNGTITPTVTNVNPVTNIQCLSIACTPPTINTQPTNVTICSTGTANVSVAATAGPYQWQYNNGGTWANVANGTPAGFSYTNSTTNNMTINTSSAAQGTYQFRVLVGDAACQVISDFITVTVPGATRLAPLGAQCSGTQLNFEAFPASGATYAWTVTPPGGTSATPTSGSGQTFSFVPTNTSGSSVTFPVSVQITHNSVTCTVNFNPTILPTPTAPVVGAITQPTCATPTGSVALSGLPSGSWTITASPGGATQNGSGTTATFTGLNPSTSYSFTVTNADGCTSTASTSAAINAAPASPSAPITGTVTQPTCLTPTGSVQLSGLPAGSWTVTATPGGATLNGSTTSATFTGLAPGNYTFIVTNGAGCTSTASSSVTINPVPGAPTAPVVGTITQTTCAVATGSVQLNGLPSGSWTLTMSPGAVVTNGSGTSTTISGLAAGTYTFTVTNDLGCTSPSSVNVVINAQPTTPTAPVLGTVTQPTCTEATGSVAISGLPAGTWTITASPGGATQNGSGTTATFSGLSAGTYTFTVTNADGCTSTVSSTSAVINPQPATPTTPITGTVTQPTCLTPTGTIELSGLPAGSWTVTATPGGATLNGSTTSATFTGLAPGNYTFTVTNGAGCTSVASSSVTINPVPGAPTAPVVGTITQTTCVVSTGSVELTGLPSGSWTLTMSPGAVVTNGSGTSTTISGLVAGTYTFTVTNDLGCTSPSSVNVVINAQPTTPTAPVLGTVTQPTCTEATGSVAISGLPAGTWTITASPGGATQNGSGTTATFTGLSAGTYTFTVTNADGCTSTVSSTSAVINPQPATPTAPITGTITQPTCLTPTGTIELSGLPAGSWTVTATPGGATLNGSTTSATFTGLAPGTNYTFTVTNNDGCTSSASSSVAINTVPGAPTAPTAGTVTQPTCAVPTGTIEVAAPLGAQYTYSIDGTTFQAGTTFSGLAPGAYTITVLDNTSGCSSVSASTVTIDPVANAPVVTLVSSTSVTCNGDSDGALEISISGGQAPYAITWDPNVGNSTSVDNLAAGSYTVNIIDDNGCSTSETFTVSAPNELLVNGTSTNVLCGIADGTITTAVAGGTAPYTYAWTPNGETTTSLSELAAGTYSVQVTDDNGCTASQSFTLNTIGNLPVNIDPSYVEIEAGESVVLTATGGDNYVWTPTTGLSCTTCPNPTANPTVTTTYYVSATDDNGCVGGDSSIVVIKLACGDLFVPTIFSPNGTGPDANNKLCVFGTASCIEELKFQVYNRWGEIVFETTDIENCWDGNYKDKPANSGIFVYRLYVKLYNNDEPIDISGNTTLVR
jgi:gliding motility-associated-like protein